MIEEDKNRIDTDTIYKVLRLCKNLSCEVLRTVTRITEFEFV